MNRSFTIPARYHPARSLLGRWVLGRIGDRRAAESTYIVAAATLALALVIGQYLAWAYLQPMAADTLRTFFVAELAVAFVYAIVVLAGRQPPVRIHVEDDGIRFRRQDDDMFIPFSEIRRVTVVSAQTYYGHYARYAATVAFVNRIHPHLLLLECPGHPVVVGLPPKQRAEFEDLLAERVETPAASRRVGAA